MFFFQASEKALIAVLYAEDCEEGRRVHSGSRRRNLSYILQFISSTDVGDVRALVSAIEGRVGMRGDMQYPSHSGVPCDLYTHSDAAFMLTKTEELLRIVRRLF